MTTFFSSQCGTFVNINLPPRALSLKGPGDTDMTSKADEHMAGPLLDERDGGWINHTSSVSVWNHLRDSFYFLLRTGERIRDNDSFSLAELST
jgi:hypothetical protein